jgi:hypothetical protein
MLVVHALLVSMAVAPPAHQTAEQPVYSPGRPPVATAMARRADQPPAIDGRADDAVWQIAPKFGEFRQFDPRVNVDPSFRTEFQVAYDERNLYVHVRMYDPHPDSIMRALSRRDMRGPSDQIKLIIDSYNDRRSGYEFAVNPDGVKRDFAIFNDDNEDSSWNGVWDAATNVDSLGWTAEFRIPLSQLRFSSADTHTFGFGIWRDIERYRERVSWPLFNPSRTGLASQLGQLVGLSGLASAQRLEMTPYAVTKNASRASTAGFDRVQSVTVGGDLKYGITPNITLDATINPDFGQVEADPAVLNLSAFETFLSERRPFFVEGTGFYKFELNCYIVVDCSTNEGLFYSRRIGRSPSLRNDHGDAATPTSTPIAFAAKLTGRTRNGLSFGLLDAVTQHVDGAGGTTVEPRANYSVLRAQQDLRGGDAGISLIATAVNRSLDDWTAPVLHSSAYVAGASVRNRLFGGQYEVAASLTASRIGGSPAAITRTQRSAVHYYQQPGDDIVVDSTRTSLSGYAGQIKFGKYGGGVTRFETSFVRQSAGFDVNDLGFLRRADLQDWSTWAALSFRENPTRVYRWLQLNVNHWETWNTSGQKLENAFNTNGHMGLHNNWNVHVGGTLGQVGGTFCDRCTRGGPALRQSHGFYPWFGVNGDSRGVIVPSMWVNLSYSDGGRSHSVSLSPSVGLRFSTRLQAELGARFANGEDDNQWFGNFTEEGITHYTFARLDQRTVSMSMRLNYTASPDLTFEFYGEPFVTRGTYTDIREVSSTPDAESYDDRLSPYTPPADAALAFKFMQLKTNAVLRWEYLPGSTLFLVWSHGRQADAGERLGQSWRNDFGDLLELHPDNTFLIKVAYWLNR